MDKLSVIFLFSLLVLLVLAEGCSDREGLSVEPFPGIELKQVICFNSVSGKIVWQYEAGRIFPYVPNECKCIGIGYFPSGGKAVIFFEYNSSKKLLIGNIARNAACECCSKSLRREVLRYIRAFS